jgi:type II restriction enzyme
VEKMYLQLPIEQGSRYRSLSQKARVITELWAEKNIFCVACSSNQLNRAKNNTEAFDLLCPDCGAFYQLKSTARPIRNKIIDSGYNAMMRAIRRNCLPHLLVLRYSENLVYDLMMIPGFALSASAIEPRKPLSQNARRAGWIGCSIIISYIPPEGRIFLINERNVIQSKDVREQYKIIDSISKIPPTCRGWTLDVLNGLHSLKKTVFSLDEVYTLEAKLADMHPKNKNIRPKIRQQLQILRDMGFLHFISRGLYEVTNHQ